MNILLVSSMEAVGGTERATQQIAELLLKAGHDVHLLCTDGPLVPALTQSGVKVHLTETHGSSPLEYARFFRDICKLLSYPFDCVHLQMARPAPLVMAAKWFTGSHVKIIWHSRGLNARTYRYLPRLFDLIGIRSIANCRTERDKLIRHGYAPDHVGYLYNPCQLEGAEPPTNALRDRLAIPRDAVVIGTLSRLAKDRGVDYAITYFHELSTQWNDHRPVYLLIGGDGQERGKLEQMAKQSSCNPHICFLGRVDNVDEFYGALDMLWNTIAITGDEGAGTGNTTIEAAFCKVPVISHACAGIGEIVESGVTGEIYVVGDMQGFIAGTIKILKDENYRIAILSNALKRVQEFCGAEGYLKNIEYYYKNL